MTDLDWPPLDRLELVVPTPRKCKRHEWEDRWQGLPDNPVIVKGCRRCPAIFDPVAARRGKNNRSRGNAVEREVAAKLGLRRVGQFGGPDDIAGLAFRGQVKSGTAYPEKLHRWLKAVPVNAGETAILVITDAPGPGHQRRALVILDLTDWQALHGPQR